jgi:lysyl endopeptidase
VFWSPTLDGDVATIEFHADVGAKLGGATLVVPRIAHHLITGAALKSPDMKTVSDIGTSGACNIDVACVTPQTTAFVNSTKSVAQILFTQEDGVSYLCSGTLLNDSITTGSPYLFTANHCINSALAARTLNTFWFFDAVACGDHTTIPAYVQQTAGATLLARSEDWDWALVRLNAAPPAGAFFSAWRSDPVGAGATVSVIHHPEGDLKKWALGTSPGYQTYSDGSSFIQARYSEGTTEGGSSGAALFTLNGAGFYEVRGGLFGGLASCAEPSGVDVYSRLDNLLPLVRQYLTPGNNPSNTVVAVEFYNKTLQHYFISTSAAEINDLDTGVHVGWERTGFRFLAYETQVAGTSPVCRFYRAPAYGDSHFYSASPAECAATAAAHPIDWIYESPTVFYIPLPNTTAGICPVGTLPVWRFFNQVTTNHRYTTDVATRDDMNSQPSVWIAEGYGPGPYYPIMCTPVGS